MSAETEPTKKNPGTELSLKVMLLYSIANMGSTAIDSAFDQFNIFFYVNRGLVQNSMLIGAAVFIGRVVDALANPLVGHWSDTSHGRRGRRIPFILRGVLPMSIFFVLFFLPISKNEMTNFVFAAFTCSAMLFFFTYVVAPYLALLPDLARSNDERVSLSTWQSLTAILGIIVGFVAAGVIQQTLFGMGFRKYDYTIMAAIIGFLAFALFMLTAFTIKEKPVAEKDRVKLDLWGSIIPSLKNRAFIIYVVSLSSFWIGFKVLQTSINFVCHKMFGKEESFGSIFGMGGMIVVWLVSLPFIFFLQKKFGKKKVFGGALFIIGVISALQGFIGYVPGGYGLYAYLGLIFCFGVPFAALLVLYNAIVGDIIDIDEKTTGFRREAMFYGMEGLFTKIARGLGALLITLLFSLFGKPSETNFTAMMLSGPVCALFAFAGFFLFRKYPISD